MKLRILAAMLGLFYIGPAQAATTLLPPGKQCFSGANGAYAAGSLNMFVPGTTTPKATWQDAAQVTLNTQPIQLDANGCAIIFGVGSYRQQLYDGPVVGGATSGNLIWDQVTTDTSATNNVFWAGVAGGTPNAITVVDTGFNATDGSVVNFTALATNTGASTLNPSGFGAISILKDTTAGPVALSGGEIIQTNPISAVFRASDNAFHLLNTVIASASGATAPLCGAVGLKIINNVGTPNSVINLTADQVVMQTTAGVVINRSNVSLTAINITTGNVTATANGMDGEVPGTSQWLNIWAIDNGAAVAGLVSTSSTAPTMPSGYTYKCRLGAMRVDGSSNLLRTLQLGNITQYVVSAAQTTILPIIVNGTAGTYSITNPVLVTASVSSFVPPTATRIEIDPINTYGGLTASAMLVAPNVNYGGTGNGPRGPAGMSFPFWIEQATTVASIGVWMTLEATTIAWCSSQAGGAIAALAWQDKVNAN